jgi:hypothetical protein
VWALVREEEKAPALRLDDGDGVVLRAGRVLPRQTGQALEERGPACATPHRCCDCNPKINGFLVHLQRRPANV